ncbi:MAG: fibronectin type III domain-containing protein, partial [Candidatus Moraniibacteriota bacterium]
MTSVSAVITWTTNINSNSLVDFGTTTSYGTTNGDAGASVTSHTVILSGLSPGTVYKYRVRSMDSLGNQTISDNGGVGYSFTTAAAPTITDVHLSLVDGNHAVVTWNTSVNAYPYVAYGLSDTYGSLVGNESTLGTSHSVSIGGLTLGTTYYFKPRVK